MQKELFATTDTAHSLIDHALRVNELAEIAGYNARVSNIFGADGLQMFIKALRNLLRHVHSVEAG